MQQTIYPFEVTDISGKTVSMEQFQGKVLLIVNTASKCGFTPQYKSLQALYEKYQEKGLVVLGFPCNQFGQQEQGDNDEINQFCELNYGVKFPLFAKIEVNGPNTTPLYQFLKQSAKGLLGSESIKWNFTKFLIDNSGQVVTRFSPATKPEKLESSIVDLLNKA
ncbi:glutathione peroxidase [Shewanella maritima]|uniref:glutathione peroxidase n=1 Tax=Shewanella maritima TaxID=2520507 RepID=UPI003735AE50